MVSMIMKDSVFLKLKESILRRIFKYPHIPNEVVLEVTDRCNLDCKFCFNKLYIKERSANGDLSTEKIKYIIDKIKRAHVPVVRFTGGEPLLRNDIWELMDYAYRQGLKVWLNTNATLITPANVRYIVKYIDNILIPLNAYNEEDEQKVTGSFSFRNKLRSIRLLQKNGIKYIRCGTVATKYNIINLERIHSLIERLNVSDWELFRVIPITKTKIDVTIEDTVLFIEKLLKINEKTGKNYKIANAIPFCVHEPEKLRQVALGAIADDGHSRFVIDSLGRAKPMYYFHERIGDVFHDEIISIWNKQFMINMRKLQFVPQVCRKCHYLHTCKGGSRIVSWILEGQYGAKDYLAKNCVNSS